MSRPLTTVWQHKHSALNPLRDAQLGFVPVTHTLADQLVAEGSAQHPRIGEFRFNRIDRTPLPEPEPPVVVVAPPVVEPPVVEPPVVEPPVVEPPEA